MNPQTPRACVKCGQANSYTKTICDFCGAEISWRPVAPIASPLAEQTRRSKKDLSIMNVIGLLLLIFGGPTACYYLFTFDTNGIAVPIMTNGKITGEVVYNQGLEQQRQYGVMLGLAAVVIGSVLLVIGSRQKRDAKVPL